MQYLHACNFIKKETPTTVFSCEYCKVFKFFCKLFIEYLQRQLLEATKQLHENSF